MLSDRKTVFNLVRAVNSDFGGGSYGNCTWFEYLHLMRILSSCPT